MGSGGGGALCDVTKGPALPGPQSPGASADQRTRSHFVSAHDAVAEEPPWMVPSGRHFRIRQNQPEHAPGWFGSNSHWLLTFLMFLVILKFPRGDDESNVCTPPGRQGCSSGPPGRKKIKASPYKDSMCGALTQVKTKLVNLVSRMRNLKLIAAAGDRRQCPNIEVLGDAQNNITVYELRVTGDADGVDFHIKEEE
ncbi:hypothetical protein ABFV05_019994 [Capra hircus]